MSKFTLLIIVVCAATFFIYKTWSNQKNAAANQIKSEAFLLENSKKPNVITTESGLQYTVIHKGTGQQHPTLKSKVKVHYHGTLIDGTVFDSSVERGKPITFGLNQVIKGWQEGLQYMVEGEKIRLFVPSALGYGNRGSGPIPPASTLIFDIELIEIK